MTTQNPKISTDLPPGRGTTSSNRIPGHTSSTRPNINPSGAPGKRGVPQSNKFSAPAESSAVDKGEKEYSDEDHHTESDRGYEDEPHFRPEHGEEPEIKSRKPRFGYKHTDEEDNQDEGIENEEDTPKNLLSLSESLMAMKNLRSNFQSFQYEAEAEEHEDDEHIDRPQDEYEDEDYVKVESGEEDYVQKTEEDVEPEEGQHYEEEGYYEKVRVSGSFSKKDHYIEKIHEEPHEESHKDDEEEIDRPQFTEEDKDEPYIQSLPSQRDNVEDVVPVSSTQELQEPLLKHDNPEEEDEKIEEQEPPKEQHVHHEHKSPLRDTEERRSVHKSQDIAADKDKIKDEKDRFFEELEGGIGHKQIEEKIPPKSADFKEKSVRDEVLRKSDNYEPPQVEDIPVRKEEPLQIKHDEPPQKEEESQQEKEDVPPPIFGLPPQRRNVPPQRGHGPPHRGNMPPRGGFAPQRMNIPQQRVNVPLQKEVETPQKDEEPLELPDKDEPIQAEPEHIQQPLSATKQDVPEKEEKPVQQIVEPPQREKEMHEAPEKEELPPIGGASIQKRVAPQREAPSQAPKFFMPSAQQENVNKQPVRFPQQHAFTSPLTGIAQKTQSDVEYEEMIVANAKDSSDNSLLVRLKNVEIELKKERKKNELLETEREKLVVESKDLKQQVFDLKNQLEHSNKGQSAESFSHKEQETLEKLRQELKTTVEGSRLVTEHSNKIIAESAKYKQEMEALVNALEEEKKQLQKTVLDLKTQVHEEQLKVETQQQKTEFFERKAKEFEESFDMVHRQLNERIETLQKLTSINNNVQTAIDSLPKIDAFFAKLQPQSNSVAVQTISSQHTLSKSLSREPETAFSGTKTQQTILSSPQVKEPAFTNPFKSSTEKKSSQTKVKETGHEFNLSPHVEEQPKAKTDLSSKELPKAQPKEEEVNVSHSSENWFESVFTSQNVSKPKESTKPTVQVSGSKVQEEKEKESEAKKDKVASGSKPSLQADDFFKDIIVPDVKPSVESIKTVPIKQEKEKDSAAKKEKVTPSSKPSLQADDFFKDIIVPDVKSTFEPIKTAFGSKVQEEKEKESASKKDKVVSGAKTSLQSDDFFKDIIIPDVKPSVEPIKTVPIQQEKEKGSATKKDKVTSGAKPSLQADDFFKDIIIPDVKSSFVSEPKSSSETKVRSPIKSISPVQKSKELENIEASKFTFEAHEEKEKVPSEAQTPEPPKTKPVQKEQPLKPEVTKSAVITTKEEPKPEPKTEPKKSGLVLPQGKSMVPQFAKTPSAEQGQKKIGPVILPKSTTSDKEKSTPSLNLGGIQTKSGSRYAPNKQSIEQNFMSVESDSFFGELGLGESSSKNKVDPFKGGLRESTSSLRSSQQGGDMFSQPVVKKKVLQ